MAKEENLIVKLTFDFAVNVLDVTEALEAKHRYALANQLTKSGTSIGQTSGNRRVAKAGLISFTK